MNENVKEQIRSKIETTLGGTAKVTIESVQKTNSVKTAYVIRASENDNMAPTIYLEDIMKNLNIKKINEDDTDTIDKIAEAITAIYKTNSDTSVIKNITQACLKDKETILDHIKMKIVNYDMNIGFTNKMPFEKYLDLMLIFYIDINENMACPVNNYMMEAYDISLTEIKEAALRHTDYDISDARNYLLTLAGYRLETSNDINEDSVMIVVCNKSRKWGNTALYDMDVLKAIANDTKKDTLYVIPSSIHETIIIPKREEDDSENIDGPIDIAALKDLITDVNTNVLENDEFVSDNLYVFDKKTGKLKIA